MKKLVVLFTCMAALSVKAEAEKKFFDEKSFKQDVEFYQQHSSDAKAILTLISATGIDRDMPIALQMRANGDVSKWTKLNNGLKKAQSYAEKISGFNYLSSCANVISTANLMWSTAVTGIDGLGWKDKFRENQYISAKKQFDEYWVDCKNVARTSPQKENYYSTHEPIVLGEEK